MRRLDRKKLRPGRQPRFWKSYRQVNDLFCQEVVKLIEPDDTVWVHDFQLMLLPRMLREKVPELEIGYFLHIPWPSFELFRLLPDAVFIKVDTGISRASFHVDDASDLRLLLKALTGCSVATPAEVETTSVGTP